MKRSTIATTVACAAVTAAFFGTDSAQSRSATSAPLTHARLPCASGEHRRLADCGWRRAPRARPRRPAGGPSGSREGHRTRRPQAATTSRRRDAGNSG